MTNKTEMEYADYAKHCKGQPQAGRNDITEKTRTSGYKRPVIDHCLFIRRKRNNVNLLVIYVDVLVVSTAGSERAEEQQLNDLERPYEKK